MNIGTLRQRRRAVRRIGFLGFDGVQALDLVGPSDAFASDAFATIDRGDHDAKPWVPYEVLVIGLTGRRFTTSSGLVIRADAVVPSIVSLDTLIIPGGAGLRRPGLSDRAAQWIVSMAPRVRRVASVCTGLYGLAATGLLDGRRVATHWSAVADIARRYPRLRVDPDVLYIKDGRFYTSAGVTAGIDLALALIEADHGPRVALAVARELVVYLKRPGGQQQFSEPLQFQLSAADRFGDLAAWIHGHLRSRLTVEVLAARAYLSVRQFARAFKHAFGVTPAEFVEEARLAEAGRRFTAATRRVRVDAVARSVGYSSEDVFRRAFERRFGVSPSQYRSRFGAAPGVEHSTRTRS
ncbi:MAG TPA: DJ-1/PfpI family protein [Gemmatimonadaceae bacterium]|nr:DJ-1/PfpI family protein [Gemmatimonadaceae bacterium]